ncbi:hypothetical protein OVW19_30590, partial [Klebsiella pneumoniae]|uniref:hypothetical protein n=1 Tax=Klebsiella pneumoniae TaxID=573 RepID=UPI00226F7AC3
ELSNALAYSNRGMTKERTQIIVVWPGLLLPGLLVVGLAHIIVVDVEKLEVQRFMINFFN